MLATDYCLLLITHHFPCSILSPFHLECAGFVSRRASVRPSCVRPPMIIEAGTRIGKYEIKSLLGAGGMGEVYRAQDTELKRPVALKFLQEDVASDEQRMQRLIHEARAAPALNHPNTLTVHHICPTHRG